MYYILSLKWSKYKEEFVWWGPNDSGYTSDLNKAGKYTEEQVNNKQSYYNDNTSTKAVKVEEVESLYISRTVPTTTTNADMLGLLRVNNAS